MTTHKTTLTRALLTWLLLSLVLVGCLLGVASYWVVKRSVEANLEQRAGRLAAVLASSMQAHVWALDDGMLREHFDAHAGEWPDMVRVSFLTEFEDPIFEATFASDPHPVVGRRPVLRDGACIGYVEAAIARKEVGAIQRMILQSAFLMIIGAAATIFLVTHVLMRVLLRRPLTRLTRGIREIAGGDYRGELPEEKHLEIDSITGEVNAMVRQIAERTSRLEAEIRERTEAERALQVLKDRLEDQVGERTLALRRAYEDLDQETRERRQIQNEMLEIARREQQRIGRDLHDTLGQQLAGASFLLGSLEKRLRDRGLPETDLAAEVGGHLRDAVAHTRQIAYGLAPTDISEEGLIDGFEALANMTRSMFGMECTFTCSPACRVSDSVVATHLYRIAQEALHNAARHGKAGHTWISLAVDQGNGVLTVRDDGIGLERCPPSDSGMGLRIMHFRAEAIGGKMDLSVNDTGGLTVTVTFKDEPPEA